MDRLALSANNCCQSANVSIDRILRVTKECYGFLCGRKGWKALLYTNLLYRYFAVLCLVWQQANILVIFALVSMHGETIRRVTSIDMN